MDDATGSGSDTPLEQSTNVELFAAVAFALTSTPLTEAVLFQHVWNYVIGERGRGTPPGRVIMTLTEMVDEASVTEPLRRQALQRAVIVAAVEAYFGRVDGASLGPAGAEYSGDAQAHALLSPKDRPRRDIAPRVEP